MFQLYPAKNFDGMSREAVSAMGAERPMSELLSSDLEGATAFRAWTLCRYGAGHCFPGGSRLAAGLHIVAEIFLVVDVQWS